VNEPQGLRLVDNPVVEVVVDEGTSSAILHLVQVNGILSWREEVLTRVSGHNGPVTITSKALGVYSLAHVPDGGAVSQASPSKKDGQEGAPYGAKQ
jgi:hypothetical protein